MEGYSSELEDERSARRQAEAERDFYRNVLRRTPFLTNVHAGAELTFVVAHPDTARIFGKRDLVGVAAAEIERGGAHSQVIEAARRVMRTGFAETFVAMDEVFESDGRIGKRLLRIGISRLDDGEELVTPRVIVQTSEISDIASITRWLEAVLDVLPLAIALSDAETGRIVYANRAARELGCDGTSIDRRTHTSAGGEVDLGAELAQRFRCSSRLISLGAGLPATFLLMAEDVMSLQAAESALDAARSALRKREESVAHLAHEIRTPLAAIIGYSSLALSGDLTPDEQGDIWRRVHNAGQQTLRVANDYLAAAAESASISIVHAVFSPRRVIHDVAATFAQLAMERGLRLILDEGVKLLPDTFASDATRLQQILTNLVANALKFTDEGSVSIDALMAEAPRILSITVTDTGIGMPTETQARLFRPYERGDGAARTRPGTGLGLALSRQLAERLGGELRLARSAVGEGSAFEIRLPEAPLR